MRSYFRAIDIGGGLFVVVYGKRSIRVKARSKREANRRARLYAAGKLSKAEVSGADWANGEEIPWRKPVVNKKRSHGASKAQGGAFNNGPAAEKLPAKHPAVRLAMALSDARLLAQSFPNEDRIQRTAQKILEVAKAIGKTERVPCLRFDFGFVGHGYQCDVFIKGREAGSQCRDFGGTYQVADVTNRFYEAIVKAINSVEAKL